ncbi:LemA family protein [Murimonas intestini]|uniref:LemA family protein n=1 Tax=Murimonas intestini TaxID=1337051 RepID=UPI000D6B4B0E|nr:LemA family protein [Murimonas intestini]MCR1864207.1 LemA family protein [Murimonas intestini]MCR1881817.1 LemA family protein [Murimonas intestini]
MPNLLETVKGYADFERTTLEAVVNARASAIGATDFEKIAAANQKLSAALHQFLALGEAYPDLKANNNFMQLQRELTETENKIALSRQFYNDTAFKYNNAIEMFPASVIAGLCGFHPIPFWETTERGNISIKAEDMKL